ncbi:peptide-methionine (R)-S-oxide reductase MsrB [Erythrobacter crassostreae]|uniref:Peptide-methionine (R)-S-oxide reductase MsrB n=1 Tax=Erythrobacter crassostreae TaxID=2828328 RepID=A0A9X1F3A9_9SPHN|nr:peptide-methionine (R)-S-oxide reductase MsrB [Erythrobacter crassostrea]MBV7258703.1 peptide-methionine (R)-S-oxide reductase MsrB [Erythrobacter crassostrea]
MKFGLSSRRRFISSAAIAASLPVLAGCGAAPAQARKDFRIRRTEAQWRRQLTRSEFRILRDAGTERAWTSPLNKEKRKGVYKCAGCGNRIYSSAHKYDSRSGWPAFYKAIEKGAVSTSVDYKIGYARTEVHCADCGGHLGHIFGDGPKPTGKRHCINGIAMDFVPA